MIAEILNRNTNLTYRKEYFTGPYRLRTNQINQLGWAFQFASWENAF